VSRRRKHTADTTGAAAMGDVAGDSLVEEIFSRVENSQDRAVLLANVGLGISVQDLARTLGAGAEDIRARIQTLLTMLREDARLATALRDIRQAGRMENHLTLAQRLGVQDYFCSSCGDLMAPSKGGRPRKTCSAKCRTDRYRYQRLSSKSHPGGTPARCEPPSDDVLRLLIQAMESSGYGGKGDDVRIRDRAFALLAFACPAELSPIDLVRLDVADVTLRARDVEVRLRLHGSKRYVTLPASDDPAVCPLTALTAWKRRLPRAGRASMPLFVRTDSAGQITLPPSRLHPLAAANIVTAAGRFGSRWYPIRATPATILPWYLRKISDQRAGRIYR
jgi:hypothetical protein